MEDNYGKALKKGKSYYKKCVANGEFPYLPVLDDMIPTSKADFGHDLGLIMIPADLIVGTKTKGRTSNFAGNFMPLADEKSEFADKWEALCQSHETEGIRDPIVAWEYMNRYYVQEGNKRVSVLKYFDSGMVAAYVKRIMPERTGDPKVELYYEYLEFNRLTKINFLEFTKPGSYKELQQLVGKEPGERWTEDEIKHFRTLYFYFDRAYKNKGGYNLKSTVGDALLTYVRTYGYKTLDEQSDSQLSQTLSKYWKEIELQQEDEQVEIKLNPEAERSNLLTDFFAKKRKAAFIYLGPIELSGWRRMHDKGRLEAEKALNGKVETIVYTVPSLDMAETVIRQAVKDGASIVFLPEVTIQEAALKVAADYPQVKFLSCALNNPYKLIHSYYPRIYEAKFIIGAIAGAITMDNKIGYIAKYPVYGMIADFNAFARGVKLINPNAKVYLEWSSIGGPIEAEKRLLDKGVHLISYRDFGNEEEDKNRMFGLAHHAGDKIYPIILPLWNWGTYYEKMIRSIIDGSYDYAQERTPKSLNYFWGISSGVMDIMYSEKLLESVRYLGETLFKAIGYGICQPFYHPNPDPSGTFKLNTSEASYSIDEIVKMDYLEDNIIGKIPKYDEVEEKVQKVIDKIGVASARKGAKTE